MRELADRLEARAKQLREAANIMDAELGPLTSGNSYVTDEAMASTQIEKHPGPRATKGPMAALAKELGLSSLRALADALGEEHHNVRSWNHRKSVPDRVGPMISRLREEKRAAKR